MTLDSDTREPTDATTSAATGFLAALGDQSTRRRRGWFRTLRVLFLGATGAALLRLLHMTYRWEVRSELSVKDLDSSPRVFAFWHTHVLAAPGIRAILGKESRITRAVTVLSSLHDDGRIMAVATTLLGFRSVAGSSTRGGANALLNLVREWRNGYHIALTPDGPKGPPFVCKSGVVKLAQLTSQEILPITCRADRAWTFKSWDRMQLPKPFTKITAVIGAPITIDPASETLDLERSVTALSALLNQLEERARLGGTSR